MLDKVKAWFKRSETIFLARAQVLIGVVGAALYPIVTNSEITGAFHDILKPAYIPYYVIVIGILTEYLRRRNAKL